MSDGDSIEDSQRMIIENAAILSGVNEKKRKNDDDLVGKSTESSTKRANTSPNNDTISSSPRLAENRVDNLKTRFKLITQQYEIIDAEEREAITKKPLNVACVKEDENNPTVVPVDESVPLKPVLRAHQFLPEPPRANSFSSPKKPTRLSLNNIDETINDRVKKLHSSTAAAQSNAEEVVKKPPCDFEIIQESIGDRVEKLHHSNTTTKPTATGEDKCSTNRETDVYSHMDPKLIRSQLERASHMTRPRSFSRPDAPKPKCVVKVQKSQSSRKVAHVFDTGKEPSELTQIMQKQLTEKVESGWMKSSANLSAIEQRKREIALLCGANRAINLNLAEEEAEKRQEIFKNKGFEPQHPHAVHPLKPVPQITFHPKSHKLEQHDTPPNDEFAQFRSEVIETIANEEEAKSMDESIPPESDSEDNEDKSDVELSRIEEETIKLEKPVVEATKSIDMAISVVNKVMNEALSDYLSDEEDTAISPRGYTADVESVYAASVKMDEATTSSSQGTPKSRESVSPRKKTIIHTTPVRTISEYRERQRRSYATPFKRPDDLTFEELEALEKRKEEIKGEIGDAKVRYLTIMEQARQASKMVMRCKELMRAVRPKDSSQGCRERAECERILLEFLCKKKALEEHMDDLRVILSSSKKAEISVINGEIRISEIRVSLDKCFFELVTEGKLNETFYFVVVLQMNDTVYMSELLDSDNDIKTPELIFNRGRSAFVFSNVKQDYVLKMHVYLVKSPRVSIKEVEKQRMLLHLNPKDEMEKGFFKRLFQNKSCEVPMSGSITYNEPVEIVKPSFDIGALTYMTGQNMKGHEGEFYFRDVRKNNPLGKTVRLIYSLNSEITAKLGAYVNYQFWKHEEPGPSSWKYFYCKLSGSKMEFFDDEREAKLGVNYKAPRIDLRASVEEKCCLIHGAGARDHTIEIHQHGTGRFYLALNSEHEAEQWMTVINTIKEQLQWWNMC